MILLLSYTLFFYKKLSSGNEYSVSYENGLFRVLSLFLRFLIRASVLDEKVNFVRKFARQFLIYLEHEYSVS